jgi:hypothetical protein
MVKKVGKGSGEGAENEAFDVVLTQEEKDALHALATQEVADEQKSLASEEYKAQVKSALKKKMLFSDANPGKRGEEKIAVFVDLPRTAPYVSLDGKRYYPNKTYHVSAGVADVLFDTMSRTFAHEREVKGLGTGNAYRREQAYSTTQSRVSMTKG